VHQRGTCLPNRLFLGRSASLSAALTTQNKTKHNKKKKGEEKRGKAKRIYEKKIYIYQE